RPHSCGDKLRGDDERVSALPVADELGECRDRSGPLAGAERRYQECGVALIEERRSSLLVSVQDATGEVSVHIRNRASKLHGFFLDRFLARFFVGRKLVTTSWSLMTSSSDTMTLSTVTPIFPCANEYSSSSRLMPSSAATASCANLLRACGGKGRTARSSF